MKAIKKNLYYAILFVCATLCSLALFGGFAMRRVFAETTETVESAYNPTMVSGASVRIMDKEKGIKDGIRFMMTMSSDEYEAIKTQEGFKSGILILPTAVSGSDAMEIGTTNVGVAETQGKWYIVYDNQEKTEYHYACCAVLTDMGAENYRTAISARGYVYTSADGYIYTDYSVGENSRTMKQVAEVAVGKTEKYDELYSLYQYITAGEIANGYVYEANGEIYSLPTFGAEKPEYTVTNASGEVTVLNGNKVKLDAAGEYTATMGENTVKFTAYSSADWARMIAPMTSNQYEDDFFGWATNKTTVTYDEEMNAFKRTAQGNTQNEDGFTVKDGSVPHQKYVNGWEKYSYVAIDVNFKGQIGTTAGTDFANILFRISKTAGGYVFLHNLNLYDTALTVKDTRDTMVKDVWYTIYVPSGMLTLQNGVTKGWMLFQQQLFAEKEQTAFTDFYVRNIRFENSLPTVKTYTALTDGYTYMPNAETQYLLPSYAYTVTKNGEPVTTNGRLITLVSVGNYVATDGTNTINFKVVSEEEYGRIIAPLNSTCTQFNSDIVPRHSSWATLTYDPTMGAYKHHATYLTAGDSYGGRNNVWTGIKADSETGKKYAENFSKYDYVAFDICIDGTYKTDYTNFLFYMSGGSNTSSLYQLHYDEVKKYDMSGNQIKSVSATTILPNTWYTVYVPLDHTKSLTVQFEQYAFLTQAPVGEIGAWSFADYWLRNVRFEAGLPA